MKIYLTGSISNISQEIRQNYKLIKKTLEELGHSVAADHIIDKTATDIKSQSSKKALEIQRKMAKMKLQSDLIIAETSVPSLGVGQEISFSLDNNKQVLALHLPGKKPHILRSINEDFLQIIEYDRKRIKKILKDHIEESRENMDVRFNFFVSPQILNYLDYVARKRKIPRAVYLRGLINREMEKTNFE